MRSNPSPASFLQLVNQVKGAYYLMYWHRLNEGEFMGHYASEIDPDWGKPTPAERNFATVEDERTRALAKAVFKGFDSGSHLDSINSEAAVLVAQTIDELIKTRIKEALGQSNRIEE